MVVKTFRGLLADSGLERIRLSTIKGKVGYRIIKLQMMPNTIVDYDAVVTVMKKSFTPSAEIDLTDTDVLAVGYFGNSARYNPLVVIIDNEIFNQDIYIGNQDLQNNPINYYIELEVIPLDDAGAEYTTLKDMRQA
jgi:hypothetical protein